MRAFKSDHGKFLCAEDGGAPQGSVIDGRPGGLATANRPEMQGWERFTLEHITEDYYALKSDNGFYLCAEDNGYAGYAAFNREAAGPWETWRVRTHGTKLSFESCRPGFFLKAWPDGRVSVDQPMANDAPTTEPGGYEQWDPIPPIDENGGGGGVDPSAPLVPADGHVRVVQGDRFADNHGLLTPVGCHFGEAFSAFTRNKTVAGRTVREQIRILRSLGFTHIRSWGNLGYYQRAWRGREVAFAPFVAQDGTAVPATPDYYGKVVAFLRMCAEEGMRVLWTDGDMNSMSRGTIESHQAQFRAAVVGHDLQHALFGKELANEKWQNFPDGLKQNEPAAVEIMRGAYAGTGWLLQNSCPPPGERDYGESGEGFAHMVQGWFPCANVHGTREFGDMNKVMRRHFNYGYERYPRGYTGSPYAMQSTEPGGPGQGVTVGNTTETWKLVGMHIATLLGRSGTVYMSSHGVFWDGPIEDQPACKETAQLKDIFTPDAFNGHSLHGGRTEAWVTSTGGFEDPDGHGYARVDQLVSDSTGRGWALAHSGRGHRRLTFKRRLAIRVRALDLRIKLEAHVESGQVVDVAGDAFVEMTRR